MRQRYKTNQRQHNALVEKYEVLQRKFLELEEELKDLRAEELRHKLKRQLDAINVKYQDATMKIETMKQQIRDLNKEIYMHKQQNQSQLITI